MEILAYARPSAVLPAALVHPPVPGAKLVFGQVVDAPQSRRLPLAHQLRDRVELVLGAAPAGVEGTSGFTGNEVDRTTKRMAVRGAPPRGRPV